MRQRASGYQPDSKNCPKTRPTPPKGGSGASKKTTPKNREYWVLVQSKVPENPYPGRAVLPFDSNPGSDDEGALVYRSFEAASCAAVYQCDMYGIPCYPVRLGEEK